jgi:hypothetical protein
MRSAVLSLIMNWEPVMDPHVRWCGRVGRVTVSPIPIFGRYPDPRENRSLHSYENTFRRSEQAVPRLLCGPDVLAG